MDVTCLKSCPLVEGKLCFFALLPFVCNDSTSVQHFLIGVETLPEYLLRPQTVQVNSLPKWYNMLRRTAREVASIWRLPQNLVAIPNIILELSLRHRTWNTCIHCDCNIHTCRGLLHLCNCLPHVTRIRSTFLSDKSMMLSFPDYRYTTSPSSYFLLSGKIPPTVLPTWHKKAQ